MTETALMNHGHGHVRPRPDGVKARCGGPALCSVCAAELAQMGFEHIPESSLPQKLVYATNQLADARQVLFEMDKIVADLRAKLDAVRDIVK